MTKNFLHLFNRHSFVNRLVAIVLRNLCGWIRSNPSSLPNCLKRISTPLIFKRSYGASKVTNNAGFLSFLLSIYSIKCTFVRIKINSFFFFISFSVYNTFSFFKINISYIQIYQFTHTYTCRI